MALPHDVEVLARQAAAWLHFQLVAAAVMTLIAVVSQAFPCDVSVALMKQAVAVLLDCNRGMAASHLSALRADPSRARMMALVCPFRSGQPHPPPMQPLLPE